MNQGGEEEDVTMADVRSKLFDTTSRLSRCTSLLQVRVRVRCACAVCVCVCLRALVGCLAMLLLSLKYDARY